MRRGSSRARFEGEGDDIVLLGEGFGELGGSEYLKVVHGLVRGRAARAGSRARARLIELLGRAARPGMLRSAHDCSDGGLAVTLAECAFDTGGIGCDVDLPGGRVHGGQPSIRSRDVSSASPRRASSCRSRPADRAALLQMAAERRRAGRTHRQDRRIAAGRARRWPRRRSMWPVAEAERMWSTAIARHFKRTAA